jgi:uncharacterized protein YbjT (DUF2867 family)
MRNWIRGNLWRPTLLVLGAICVSTSGPRAQAADKPQKPAFVVIAGASGQTGRSIVAAALDSGLRVRGLSSDLARARRDIGAVVYDRVEWRQVDVRDAATVAGAVRGADFVISAIGAREWDGPMSPQFIDFGGNVNLIDAARAHGVKRFVLISSAAAGPHRDQSQAPMLGYVRKWKTQAEAHLRASGLPYTIIGPAGLLDSPGGRDGLAVIARENYVSTNVSRHDVARVAVFALQSRDALNKSFALIGDRPGDPERWRTELRALPQDSVARGDTNASPPRIDQLSWMAGHWASSGAAGGWSEEIWLAPQGTLMPGLNREVASNGRTQFEFLRIEQRATGQIVYVASPGGGPTTDFTLTQLGTQRATFENPAHDFPRRLTYWREGNVLHARAEGEDGGKARLLEYRWPLRREP